MILCNTGADRNCYKETLWWENEESEVPAGRLPRADEQEQQTLARRS